MGLKAVVSVRYKTLVKHVGGFCWGTEKKIKLTLLMDSCEKLHLLLRYWNVVDSCSTWMVDYLHSNYMQHLKLNQAWSSGSHLEHDVGKKTMHL